MDEIGTLEEDDRLLDEDSESQIKVLNEKKLIKKVGPSYNWHWEIVNK